MRWDFWRRGPSQLLKLQEEVDLLREAVLLAHKVQMEHQAQIVALQASWYAPEQHLHPLPEPPALEQHVHPYAELGHGHIRDLVREESTSLLLTENPSGTVICPDCQREFDLQHDLNMTNHTNSSFRCPCGCELMVRASALVYTVEVVSVDIAIRKASGP